MAENSYIFDTPSTEKKKKKKWVFKPFRDRRYQISAGFFLIFLAVYLFAAFTSYLFTAQADQSVVEAYDQTGIREAGEEIENWLGIYGAIISYYAIYRWFGLGAFLLVPLLFVQGFRMVFRIKIIAVSKLIGLLIFASLWLSTLLGYMASNLPENSWLHSVAGVTGYAFAQTLDALLGYGAVLLLIVCFVAFAVYFFNITSLKKQKIVKETEPTVAPISEKVERKPLEESPEEIDPPLAEDLLKEDTIEDELEKLGIKLINKQTGEVITNKKTQPETKIFSEKNENTDDEKWEYKNNADFSSKQEEKLPDDEEDNEIEEKIWSATIPDTHLKHEKKQEGSPKEIALEIENKAIELEEEADIDEENEEYQEDDEDEEFFDSNLSTPYDPTQELSLYKYPTIDLLKESSGSGIEVSKEELEANKDKIVATLGNYGIGISSIKATIGPTVTLYEIVPDAGVRISKIKNLEDDIALSLAALGIRIIAPIPGKGTIGIEVPNQKRELVAMRSLIASEKFRNSTMDLPIAFGKTVSNEIFMVDLTKMPHLLMAGATGQGKSVGLNVILASLLYKKHPSQLKFVLIDPKKVELTLFNKIEKHFLAKLPNEEEAIITDTSKVVNTLNSLCIEMDTRYSLLKEAACRNIKEYNHKFVERKLNPKKGHRFLPYIVVIIDELADLMMTAGKEVEQPIARLAQLARAIGIHLVVATQRPSVNVITGIIKANFPARLSFRVTAKIDSRTILDTGGAEQLIGMGDMLYSTGSDLTRLQCAFIDTPEVENLCNFIASQQGYSSAYLLPEYVGEASEGNREDFDFDDKDSLFDEAARIVVMHQQGSTSLLQRRLKIGYNRAGRLIDQLEKAGIVGAFEGSKAREVLIPDEVSLEKHLKSLG
jgi:S-DNA-T family DNA segregation ATPase FtsK/SpoIIIE